VADGDDLAARVAALLTKPDELATMTAAAARFIAAQDDQLDAIASRLITTLKLDTP
jgi:3-deoxy-D-manno-octulosonic-acid transferase